MSASRRRRSSRPIRCGPGSSAQRRRRWRDGGRAPRSASKARARAACSRGTRSTATRCSTATSSIVGSGAGGAPVAAELAEAGFDVVVLEEGSYYQTRDFTADTSAMVRQLYRDGGATMAIGNPPIMFQEGRAVGGSTVINGGMSWRTPDEDPRALAQARPASTHRRRRRSSRTSSASRSASTSRRWTTTRSAATTGCSRRAPTRRAGRSSATCATRRTASARTAARSAARPARSRARSSATSRARCTSARAIYADVRVDRITRARQARDRRASATSPADGGAADASRCARSSSSPRAARSTRRRCSCARASARARASSARTSSMHPNVKVVAIFDEDVTGWKGVHQAFQVREFQDQGLGCSRRSTCRRASRDVAPASRPRSSAS